MPYKITLTGACQAICFSALCIITVPSLVMSAYAVARVNSASTANCFHGKEVPFGCLYEHPTLGLQPIYTELACITECDVAKHRELRRKSRRQLEEYSDDANSPKFKSFGYDPFNLNDCIPKSCSTCTKVTCDPGGTIPKGQTSCNAYPVCSCKGFSGKIFRTAPVCHPYNSNCDADPQKKGLQKEQCKCPPPDYSSACYRTHEFQAFLTKNNLTSNSD